MTSKRFDRVWYNSRKSLLILVIVLAVLAVLWYSPFGKVLFGWAGHPGEEAVPPSEVYYSFDSGGANTGTSIGRGGIGSAAIPREVNCADVGVLGNDCEFPGTAEGFVTLPPEILNGKTDFSISFWMKTEREEEAYALAALKEDQSEGMFIGVGENDGVFSFGVVFGRDPHQAPSREVLLATLFSKSTWHHAVIIRKQIANAKETVSLYVDGLLNAEETVDTFGSFTINLLQLSNSDSPFTGSLDELRFYDRVLQPVEVTNLYNEGIVSCGEEITKSRTLINDLDCSGENKDVLRISADNVVLDCDKQFNLIKAKQDYQGIIISGRSDVTVRDCQVEGANVGISVRNSRDITLEKNTLTNNNDFGISFIGTSNSNLIDNTLGGNRQGINIENSGSNGINTIQKNRIFDSTGNGITLRGSQRTKIGGEDAEQGNTINNNLYGIHLTASTPNNEIRNNFFTNNRETSITLISGVSGDSIIGSDRNLIEHNTIRGSKKGIYLSQSTGNTVKDNNIQGTQEAAIHLDNAGATLQTNVLNNNAQNGLYLQNIGENTVIQQNDVCHNEVDLFCEGTTTTINGDTSRDNLFGGRDRREGITCNENEPWPKELVHYFSCIDNPEDTDGDGIRDTRDNCPLRQHPNADQLDIDRDGQGDVCDDDKDGDALNDADEARLGTNPLDPDFDNDGICDGDAVVAGICVRGNSPDNCPTVQNVDQHNTDGVADGGDACDSDDDNDGDLDGADNCPLDSNADQRNSGGLPAGDVCDPDDDGDGDFDIADNCPLLTNADQANLDDDAEGNACDADDDGDGVTDITDNCPLLANPVGADGLQLNTDGDVFNLNDPTTGGDACDPDDDNDGILDDGGAQRCIGGNTVRCDDNCITFQNADQADVNRNGIGNVCEDDADGDTILNAVDNCPFVSNRDQLNTDRNPGFGAGDDLGDVCDTDDDDDGIADSDDNCPLRANVDQADEDEDSLGDGCDSDADNDGVNNVDDAGQVLDAFPIDPNEQTDTDADGVGDNADNCPADDNQGQEDTDSDGVGDACDNCRDVDNGGLTRSQCLSNENGFLAGLCQQVDTNSNRLGDACEAVTPVSTLSMNSLEDLNNLDTRLVGGRVVSVEERRQLPQSGLASDPQSCVVENCFAFDGQDYIEIRDERLKVKRVTISVWARSDINGSRYATEAYLFNKKSGDRIGTYALGVDPGTDKMKFTIRTDQGTSYSVSALDSLDTQWHHYVTRFDGFELGLYVDGELSRRTVIDQPNILLNVTGPLRIGSRPDGVGFWRGRMDELQVQDGAMDHEEIVGLHTAQNDRDSDGIVTRDDNCPAVDNADQRDSDHDGIGNACDSDVDVDGDGVPNEDDNCPAVPNPNQEDDNHDNVGDACQGEAGQPCNVDRTCEEGLACSIAARCAADTDDDNVADDDEPASCRTTQPGRKVYSNGCLVGDVNADRCVNLVDITILSQSLRANFIRSSVCAAPNPALTEQQGDLNKDGCVNFIDVATLSPALRTSFDRNCR